MISGRLEKRVAGWAKLSRQVVLTTSIEWETPRNDCADGNAGPNLVDGVRQVSL